MVLADAPELIKNVRTLRSDSSPGAQSLTQPSSRGDWASAENGYGRGGYDLASPELEGFEPSATKLPTRRLPTVTLARPTHHRAPKSSEKCWRLLCVLCAGQLGSGGRLVTTLDAAANSASWGNSSNAVHAGYPEATISSCPGKPVASDGCPLGLADPWNATPGGDPLAGFSLMGEPQITLARTAANATYSSFPKTCRVSASIRYLTGPGFWNADRAFSRLSLGRHEGRRAARRGLQPVRYQNWANPSVTVGSTSLKRHGHEHDWRPADHAVRNQVRVLGVLTLCGS